MLGWRRSVDPSIADCSGLTVWIIIRWVVFNLSFLQHQILNSDILNPSDSQYHTPRSHLSWWLRHLISSVRDEVLSVIDYEGPSDASKQDFANKRMYLKDVEKAFGPTFENLRLRTSKPEYKRMYESMRLLSRINIHCSVTTMRKLYGTKPCPTLFWSMLKPNTETAFREKTFSIMFMVFCIQKATEKNSNPT